MTRVGQSLPLVRRLREDFSLVEAFTKLATRPGCLWFDSASLPDPAVPSSTNVGLTDGIARYSFLTADPIETLTASVGQDNPWPTFDRWCRGLPSQCDDDLPPFQGGVAGLIGYEAASWLEPVGVARINDLPTPAMSLGLYDWVIALDHETQQAWLISQGLGASDPDERLSVATDRADEVEALLHAPLPTRQEQDRAAGETPPNRAGKSLRNDRPAGDGPMDDGPVEGSPTEGRLNITSNFTSDDFQRSVAEIVRRIHDGDSFQVNLAQRLLCEANLPAAELYLRLRAANPAPFGAYYGGSDFSVLSSSPERFLKVRGRQVETRPIKGTIPRTGDAREDDRLADKLLASEKDRAENIMIVDLMRNDLSRVCSDDSVKVGKLCEVERYRYVQHLVSVIRGRLRADKSIVDLVQACFPGGSVTGAPKIEAMRTIAALEPHHRGPYCGSLGYIGCGGNADFNILIRTITAAHGQWQIPVGGGITARSDPAAEEAETWTKAEGMLRALT